MLTGTTQAVYQTEDTSANTISASVKNSPPLAADFNCVG